MMAILIYTPTSMKMRWAFPISPPFLLSNFMTIVFLIGVSRSLIVLSTFTPMRTRDVEEFINKVLAIAFLLLKTVHLVSLCAYCSLLFP